MKTSRRSDVAPFRAMDVLKAANALEAQGRKVYHLETGQPGAPAPKLALAAAQRALVDDPLGYTEALGRPALRAAIARRYQRLHGLDIDPARVIVTTGSSAGFILAFLALFDAGEVLIMPSPGYPAYRNTAAALNLVPRIVPAGPDTGFLLTPDLLRAQHDAAGLLIASPGNPTGTVLTPAALRRLAESSREREWSLIADEIYHGLTYDAAAETILTSAPDAIVINSFSKYFAMTGWRIGWMIVPDALIRPMERLAQNLYISPPAISQAAAMGALEADAELQKHVALYRRNRDVLAAALQDAGIRRIAPPDGAFYLYADISALGQDSSELARRLLDETGVAATPGWDFDPDDGGRWIRFSYAGTAATIAAAAPILSDWFSRG